MAGDKSMDIVVQFDMQELRNAVDQTRREAVTRYDLKSSNIEIELTDENINVTADSENQIEAVYGILLQKMVGRKVSPKILDRQKAQQIGGMRMKQEMKLIKVLDQDSAKLISKIIRDRFPKAKPVIQGSTVRVSSKSIDDLQAIIRNLQADEAIKLPLEFTNYR